MALAHGHTPFPLLRLLRPWQWVKSLFVLLGPLYGLRDMLPASRPAALHNALLAAAVFALASSACYVFNDLRDARTDKAHPRKAKRPIPSGAVSPGLATVVMVLCWLAAGGVALFLPEALRPQVLIVVSLYVLNVVAYSLYFKHAVIADVVSLSLGFVLRVVGGCFAAGISPTTWLLNCTLFVAMFLAFGKRLGERRTAQAQGYDAADARSVQGKYTDTLLRMAVVVTAVAALLSYAGYVQARESEFQFALGSVPAGFNWMWLSIVPAAFVVLRAMVVLEKGVYDDPTEVALGDRPVQAGLLAFVALSGAVIWYKLSLV